MGVASLSALLIFIFYLAKSVMSNFGAFGGDPMSNEKIFTRNVLCEVVFLLIIAFIIYRVFSNQYKEFLFGSIPNNALKHIISLIMILIFGFIEIQNVSKARISQSIPFLNSNRIVWNSGLGCVNEHIDHVRSYTDVNINIDFCFFSRLRFYPGAGGVIYVNGASYSMYINNSMFFNCTSPGNGGAIFFASLVSCLRRVCVHRCYTTAAYHFAHIEASQENLLDYLSVSYCSYCTTGTYSTYLFKGNTRVDSINSSMNHAGANSGLCISTPTSFTSSHCTFSNNQVTDHMCINFYSDSGTVSWLYTNVVHNNSPSGYGVVYTYGPGIKKMMYCIFQSNQNYLFSMASGSLEVSHSFIDHQSSIFSTFIGISTALNNSFIERMTYQLQFFNSLYCNTDIQPPQSNNNDNIEGKSNLILILSAIGLLLILLIIIAIILYYRNQREKIHNNN